QVAAATRPVHLWNDIVEKTLRQFRTLSVPADGIAVRFGYNHKAYEDEADLRAHLHETHGQPEITAFFLLLSDVTELIAQRLSSQQLVDRAVVLVDGTPTRLTLAATHAAEN